MEKTAVEIRAVKAGLGVLCAVCVLLVAGCSQGHNILSSGSPTPTPTPAARMAVSDQTSGAVNVVNAATDVITRTVAALSPGKMVSAGGVTLVASTLSNTVAIFDNASESIRFNVSLLALPLDIAITPDGATAWIAEGNGTVQSINTANNTVTGTFASAGVQRIVLGPQGLTVLAFNDTLANSFAFIRSGTITVVTNSGLDHPANGVFAGDDSHFFVLDCGPECGGVQANVVNVTLNTTGPPTVSAPLNVSGATVGLFSGTTLFVAGSPATGLNAGTLQVVSTPTFTAGPVFNIADGRHGLMSLTSNGRLYVGSTNCTLGTVNAQNQRQGCLTIFDPVAHTVTPVLLPASRPNGDATALAPVAGRNVIYVVQGGKVDIFDIITNAVSTTAVPPNIPGTAFGAVQLNP